MAAVPNFFVAIRLASTALADSITRIQDEAILKAANLHRCRMNVKKLHLTCFVLPMNTADVSKAEECLLRCQDALSARFAGDDKQLVFDRVGNFSTRVLFTFPYEGRTLDLLRLTCSHIEEEFLKAGLLTEPAVGVWKPHCTILKTSYDRKAGRKLKIMPEAYEGCEDHLHSNPSSAVYTPPVFRGNGSEVGAMMGCAVPVVSETVLPPEECEVLPERGIRVALSTIDLLSMQEVQEDGYYRSYAQIHF